MTASSLPQSWRCHCRQGVRRVGSLDADESAAAGSPIALLRHIECDVRAEDIELLEIQVEAGVTQCLQKILALNPERLLVVPRCPTAIFAIQESSLGAKFRQPQARQAFVLAQKGELVSGRPRFLERENTRHSPPKP